MKGNMSTPLTTHQVDVDQLNPSLYNPRKWSDKAIKDLTESIRRFGLIDPIIANSADARRNIVIGGHFRLKVAKDLGYKTVPVVYVDIPKVEKEKELNLRLNRNTGEWDLELLQEFDVSLLLDVGFDNSDLESIWDQQLFVDEVNFNTKEAIQKIKDPITKVGDIYQLGEHKLICGDSTQKETFQKLLGEEKTDMLYFDPPYNINLDYSKGISTNGKYGGEVKDNKSYQDYVHFIESVLQNGLDFSKSDIHVFTWCDEKYIGLLQSIYSELSIDHKRVCLWIKNNHNMTPQIAFNKVYEPCVYGIKGKPYLGNVKNLNEILNKEIETGNQVPDDILDMFSIWLADRKSTSEYLHPTEKPTTLHEKPLRRCTRVGDLVLDAFGGSGSTLIACEQMKRKAYLIEMSPIFCDVIIQRYEQLTGRKAILCK